jgi:hypothetical protein
LVYKSTEKSEIFVSSSSFFFNFASTINQQIL